MLFEKNGNKQKGGRVGPFLKLKDLKNVRTRIYQSIVGELSKPDLQRQRMTQYS